MISNCADLTLSNFFLPYSGGANKCWRGGQRRQGGQRHFRTSVVWRWRGIWGSSSWNITVCSPDLYFPRRLHSSTYNPKVVKQLRNFVGCTLAWTAEIDK